MKKIIVLGGRGMLGQMVVSYFKNITKVAVVNERYTFENRINFLDKIRNEGEGIVVNCVGKIKQKSTDLNELLWVNTTLPLDIQTKLKSNQFLIQPSTDCVYDGALEEGKYSKDQKGNAVDEYGLSKYFGEKALENKKNALVIRVSIVGPDSISSKPKGLLEWFLSNPSGAKLKGFNNHLWNGITTLEWCKQLHELIKSEGYLKHAGSLIQLGTQEVYTKRIMLDLFQQYYNTDYVIDDFATDSSINRCLEPDIVSPSLEEQLNELTKTMMPNYE